MSRMLTLIHAGWASVKLSAKSGRRHDALSRVKRLLARPDVPTPIAADAHRLAAELLIECEHYSGARRHIRAALALEPKHARTHYLLGVAYESDPDGCDRRAARRYRNASELEPNNTRYRAAYGRALIRSDCLNRGSRELLTAANTAPDSVAVLRVVVEGLLEAGRVKAARRVVIRARFLCSGNRVISNLWNHIRFETARIQQLKRQHLQDATLATEGDFVSLPFVRIVTDGERKSPLVGGIRRDLVSKPKPHLPRLRTTWADR